MPSVRGFRITNRVRIVCAWNCKRHISPDPLSNLTGDRLYPDPKFSVSNLPIFVCKLPIPHFAGYAASYPRIRITAMLGPQRAYPLNIMIIDHLV